MLLATSLPMAEVVEPRSNQKDQRAVGREPEAELGHRGRESAGSCRWDGA